VPNISITVALLALVLDMGVLIYFINHITSSIQLPQVIASIAGDLATAIAAEGWRGESSGVAPAACHSPRSSARWLAQRRRATARSGYLQFVHYDTLVRIASRSNAVIRLHYRPASSSCRSSSGHRLAAGGGRAVTRSLERAHLTGPYRTLAQDSASPSTSSSRSRSAPLGRRQRHLHALTCIDWLGESLCKIAASGRRPRSTATRAGRSA